MTHCYHCLEGRSIQQFERIQALYGKNKARRGQSVNVAFEVIHSFSPEESRIVPAGKVNLMGVTLAKRYFPDHEFVVVTHTDTNKTHNHILVNPVNEKTGKRDITDQKKHLYNLRTIANDISRENELSIIRPTGKEKARNIPQKVKEIQRRGGQSYRLDLFQKADFARSYATSFDEYVSLLNELSVKVAITEKTITYHYEGHEKGIRGKKLGANYDKSGLMEKFKSNDELFLKQPQVRSKIRDGISNFKDGKRDSLGASSLLSMFGGNAQKLNEKDYKSYTKSDRRAHRTPLPSNDTLSNSIIPMSEIKRASNSDILDYCKKHNIACIENKKGETTLKGREHVVIHGNRWTNTKNKTTGSLIELVSLHEDISFLGAIAKITGNQNLSLLEQHFGEVKKPYKSFHIPKIKTESPHVAEAKIKQFFRHHKINEGLADDLFKQKRVQIDQKGGIWFYSDEDQKEAVQYTLASDNSYKAQYHGRQNTPLMEPSAHGSRVTVYTDFLHFLKAHGKKALSGKSKSSLVLRGLDEQAFHIFLATRPQIKSLEFVDPENKGQQTSKKNLSDRKDFMDRQKKQLEPFDISVSTISMEKAMARDRGLSI